MKIIELHAQNVKRLKAVDITPKTEVVLIGGQNGAGKSSVLDSIYYALAGAGSLPQEPVRRGEERGEVELNLGEFVVRRTFTSKGGTSLTITDADGRKSATPQELLNKLVGNLAFDPLEFSRKAPREQMETLKKLVGVDTSQIEAKHLEIFNERAAVNRQITSLKNQILAIEPRDVPGEEVSTSSILQAQADAAALRQALNEAAVQAERAAETLDYLIKRESCLEDELQKVRQSILTARQTATETAGQLTAIRTKLPKSEPDFAAQLREIESRNIEIRRQRERKGYVEKLKQLVKEGDELTRQLDRLVSDKRQKIAEAKFPIDGLGFDAGHVTYRDLPLDQCSSAEMLRISAAIGTALNPSLKILLIRDGSLLDDASMNALCELAHEKDTQVWIEVVRTDQTVSVVIEDGMVKSHGNDNPAHC